MTTTMKQQCTYLCGPYKDFCGRAEYDDEAGIFHGDVVGTQDVVTFQGKDLPELKKAFCESVDDYLAFCKELGQEPEKPFSGRFVTRLPPELHRKITMLAETAGMSLNQFVCQCLEQTASASEAALPRTAMSKSPIVCSTSAKLRRTPKKTHAAKSRAKHQQEYA